MRRLVGALIGGGVAVFGGVSAVGDDSKRDDQGAIVEAGGVGVFALGIGDCLQLPDAIEVQSVEGVPCDEPHDAQVYGESAVLGEVWPGEAELERRSAQECLSRWDVGIGTDYDADRFFDFTFFAPTAEGWAAGDRGVQCLLVRIDGVPFVGDFVRRDG